MMQNRLSALIAAALGAISLVLAPMLALAQPADQLLETRICGNMPARDFDGRIARSSAVLAAYQRIHPCPATGKNTGACPGWSIDHVIPLACGGCDAVSNLQWLPNVIKSAPGTVAKDRWECRICAGQIVTMPVNLCAAAIACAEKRE